MPRCALRFEVDDINNERRRDMVTRYDITPIAAAPFYAAMRRWLARDVDIYMIAERRVYCVIATLLMMLDVYTIMALLMMLPRRRYAAARYRCPLTLRCR